MKTVRLLSFLGSVAITLTASFANASSFSYLVGGEADTKGQASYYTGLVAEKSLQKNLSLIGRIWMDYLTYQFEKGADLITTKAPAIQTAVGIKRFDDSWYMAFWGGWEHRNTTIAPDRQDVEVQGSTDSIVLQTELDTWLPTATNLGLIASYSTHNRYTWGRGRIKQESSLGSIPIRFGFEVVGQGNADYHATQFGPVFELCTLSCHASITFHGGYKRSSGDSTSKYGGVEVYVGF